MVKVDTSKLDGLLDLVGEMVIAQSLVSQNLGQLAGVNAQAARNMAQLARITKELQRVSMSLRMVPIRGLFQKMARVTRDLGAKQQKKVNFITSGEDTELDRGVVEELNDPLLHMIRNSVDHGIESPEKRAAAGKPASGTLNLRAYHQGGNIVVEVEDDGAGLNRERILKKAIERGLIAARRATDGRGDFSISFSPPAFPRRKKSPTFPAAAWAWTWCAATSSGCAGAWTFPPRPARARYSKSRLPLTLAIIDGLIVKVGGGALHHPDAVGARIVPARSRAWCRACRTARRW